MNASLLSVQPQHARNIFTGAKTVELRRRAPRVGPGHVFFIYESAPTMAVRGFAYVEAVAKEPLDALWAVVGEAACVSFEEFSTYFADRADGVAITLSATHEFEAPISLREARALAPCFHPPQSWTSFGALPSDLQAALMSAFRRSADSAREVAPPTTTATRAGAAPLKRPATIRPPRSSARAVGTPAAPAIAHG